MLMFVEFHNSINDRKITILLNNIISVEACAIDINSGQTIIKSESNSIRVIESYSEVTKKIAKLFAKSSETSLYKEIFGS